MVLCKEKEIVRATRISSKWLNNLYIDSSLECDSLIHAPLYSSLTKPTKLKLDINTKKLYFLLNYRTNVSLLSNFYKL